MPFDMKMDEGYLHIRLHGLLTKADLVALGDAVLALEAKVAITPSRITDMTAVDAMEVGFSDMLALAERRRASTVSGPIKSAIVVANPVQYGTARIFQTLNDHPQVTLEIFHDRASAIDWIRASGKPVA